MPRDVLPILRFGDITISAFAAEQNSGRPQRYPVPATKRDGVLSWQTTKERGRARRLAARVRKESRRAR